MQDGTSSPDAAPPDPAAEQRPLAVGAEAARAGAGGRGVLEGAFALLHALPRARGPRQVAQLVAATGLPRPTVHRLLAQLVAVDAVEVRAGEHRLSAGVLALSQHVEPVDGLRRAAAGVVQAVREQTGATTSLVVESSRGYVALEMVAGRERLPFDSRDGVLMPPNSAAEVLLRRGCSPQRLRPRWGSAVDHEDVMAGITCYAVPVALPGGERAALQVATAAPAAPGASGGLGGAVGAAPAVPGGVEALAPFVHRAARVIAERAGAAGRSTGRDAGRSSAMGEETG